MYAFSDSASIALMLPQIQKDMTMIQKMGRAEIRSTSQGMGDIKINSLIKLMEDTDSRLILGSGLSLPTGSINEEDNGSKLPYGMQLGSGSYGLNLIATYVRTKDSWSFGSQISMTTYLNENTNDYKIGNKYQTSLWLTKSFNNQIGTSVRLTQDNKDPISSNEDSVSTMSTSFNPKEQHGTRRVAFLGLDYTNSSFLTGHRIALEYGIPVGFNLAGYQLKSDKMLTLGWQKTF